MTGNIEYEIWNKSLGAGIRNQSLLNLMWIQLKLYEQYNEKKRSIKSKLTPGKGIRFSTYLTYSDRIKDIEKILNCSERTARDYAKALIYFELTNSSKLIIHQTRIEIEQSEEKK